MAVKIFILFIALCVTLVHCDDIRFFLYTKYNTQAHELKAHDLSTLSSSAFLKNSTVKILTHGFECKYTDEFPQDMKNTYLAQSEDYNVITVDWAPLAVPPENYAIANTSIVGRHVAKLIDALVDNGYTTIPEVHYVGHSMGAQVGGFTAVSLRPHKLARITGLDPAGPGFENSLPADRRLDPTDADFVDVVATSCGMPCLSDTPRPPRGTVDFYANGGLHQPGCEVVDAEAEGLCSHCRAYKYYEESISNPKGFISYKCKAHDDPSSCDKSQSEILGEYVSKSARGVYDFQTKAQPPFARG